MTFPKTEFSKRSTRSWALGLLLDKTSKKFAVDALSDLEHSAIASCFKFRYSTPARFLNIIYVHLNIYIYIYIYGVPCKSFRSPSEI